MKIDENKLLEAITEIKHELEIYVDIRGFHKIKKTNYMKTHYDKYCKIEHKDELKKFIFKQSLVDS